MTLKNNIEGIIIKWAYQIEEVKLIWEKNNFLMLTVDSQIKIIFKKIETM